MRDSAPAGFVDFVVARGPALHRTAVLLTHQEQAAVDLVQVALAKAWRTWSRIDGNPEAYVRRIIINEFTSASPRRWHGQQPTAELPERHRDSDSDDADSMSRVLLAALAPLPARQRAVVVLRFFHDYPEAAIAEAMGTRIGTVRSRTFDALAALRSARGRKETYDLLFIDPPYARAHELGEELSAVLPSLLAPGARIVVESDRRSPLELDVEVERQRRYGDTSITIHRQR